jgi:hypothetical protein
MKMLIEESFLKHAVCVCVFLILNVATGLLTCEAAPLLLHPTEVSKNIMFLRQMLKAEPCLIKNKQQSSIALLNLSITPFRRM